uniref:Uncharacterized protein n=1 Tax=Tanacetum cinerariifolium TaxID=118510 RepID=A0A699KLG8_TANCI|nr:hypothetical protein [Tanacetum cinerariifolium]
MFWHTARDDTMFTSMRCISIHEDTQVYGTILPKELTNQVMLESKAYKTYYAFASGEKTPKPNEKEDEDDENDSVDKSDGNDDDGGGSSDDHDDDSDDKKMKSNKDEIPNPNLTNVEQTEQEEKEYSDQRVYTPPDYELTDDEKIHDEENINGEERMDEEEEDDVTKELFEPVEEDVHVTLTPVLDTHKADEPVQSSSVSFNFTSMLLNLENPSLADNEIASLLDTIVRHATTVLEITSSFTTTITPPPSFFNPILQQATQTPTPTPTTFKATTLFPSLLDFSFVFRFNDRVTNLEKDLSELKQVDQYAQAIFSIPSIVDRYMDNKLVEAIHKAIQTHNAECREEVQAEKQEYIDNIDSTVRTFFREEVKTQLPKILPKAVSALATPVIEKKCH